MTRSTSARLWSGASQDFLHKRNRGHPRNAVDGYDVFSSAPVELGRFDTVVQATMNVVDDALYQCMGGDARVVRVGDCLA